MKESKKLDKKARGSIGIFVLIGLLFMASFLMLLFAGNMNKEKSVYEQFAILRDIYLFSGSDDSIYQDIFENIKEKTKQLFTETVLDSNSMELSRTFAEKVGNFRIYGDVSRIPDEYQEVEYIKVNETNPHTTYIMTDIQIKNISKIICKYSYENFTSSYNPMMLSSAGSDKKSSAPYICTNGVNSGNIVLTPQKAKETNLSPTTFTATYTNSSTLFLKIGGWNDSKWTAEGKYFYVEIYDKTAQKVFNGIACFKKLDESIGLFDTITNTFYSSAGSSFYTKGENFERGIGNKITDLEDVNYGKYQIPIRLTNRNDESENYSIYLNSPLKENEYIDFRDQKVVRSDGTLESITLPELSTYEDYTKIEVLTDIAPSKIEVTYTGYTLD